MPPLGNRHSEAYKLTRFARRRSPIELPMSRCRRSLFRLAVASILAAATIALFADPPDPLPSWKEGPAKQAILDFIHQTTDPASERLVPAEDRIAVFDQDGTLWVEHPMYTQIVFCLERVPEVVRQKPELKAREVFKTVLSGDREAIGKLSISQLVEIVSATLTDVTVEEFDEAVRRWISTAKHPRWKRPYTELTYLPMQEVLRLFRASGYKTFIVTGGGQDFVRVYAQAVYGIPPEQVVGTMGGTKFGYDKTGRPILTKEPKLILKDDYAGKPEGIHLVIGRRPRAAFGNSIGDQQMLEYTGAGDDVAIDDAGPSRRCAAGICLWARDAKSASLPMP